MKITEDRKTCKLYKLNFLLKKTKFLSVTMAIRGKELKLKPRLLTQSNTGVIF